jgi:hypothetical protein
VFEIIQDTIGFLATNDESNVLTFPFAHLKRTAQGLVSDCMCRAGIHTHTDSSFKIQPFCEMLSDVLGTRQN